MELLKKNITGDIEEEVISLDNTIQPYLSEYKKNKMKQIIEQIKNRISECKVKGDMFHLPSIDRVDAKVTVTEIESHGSVLCGDEYHIVLANGDWIHIVSESKDKMRTFQTNPDRSVITVTSSDSSLNFTDAWDERF